MNVINQQILSYQQSDAGLLEQIEKETKNLEKHKADLTGLYEEKSSWMRNWIRQMMCLMRQKTVSGSGTGYYREGTGN